MDLTDALKELREKVWAVRGREIEWKYGGILRLRQRNGFYFEDVVPNHLFLVIFL